VVKEDMAWAVVAVVAVVVAQHLGRECMTTFRNQTSQLEAQEVEVAMEEAEGDIREDVVVAVREAPLHRKVDHKVHRLPMPQLDRRMLESRARTIVVVVEAETGASTLMLAVESQRYVRHFNVRLPFGDTL
jgi:hypothetical protein